MTELETLQAFQLNPNKIIWFGDTQTPKPFCYQADSELTNYSKSLFERLVAGGVRYENLRYTIRIHPVMVEFISKMFYDNSMRICRDQNLKKPSSSLSRVISRVCFFDLVYTKEFKQDIFRMDLDEVYFAFNLLRDVTRLFYKNEGMQGQDDNERMAKAFSCIKGKIGIIVPHHQMIDAYTSIFAKYQDKLSATLDDIMIGTPDDFRGVEKEIIIISSLRNSTVHGLG